MSDTSSSVDRSHEHTPEPELERAHESDVPAREDVTASPSEAGESKETLLEAVLKAVDPDRLEPDARPSEAAPTSKGETHETLAAGGAPSGGKEQDDLSNDPSEEELAGYNERTRRRIQKLLGERNGLRAEADVTRTLRNFLVLNDIAREDFQLTLDLAAAMRRGDFKSFLEGVAPYVNLATQALGITLPPDLAQAVQQGQMTQEIAAQMSRDRYARALAEQTLTRQHQLHAAASQTQGRQELQRTIEQTVDTWESQVKASDPDFARKEATVKNLLWAVVRERGAPQTPDEAVAIAQEAYERANETIRAFIPQPRATRPVPSSINRSSANGARPEPKTMLEAAYLGLERARNA